jgi:hypothetical protein
MLYIRTSKKKQINFCCLLFLNAFLLFGTGCGSEKSNDNPNAATPQGSITADLSSLGLPVLIDVPDSTVAPLSLITNPQGGVNVKAGRNFQITITETKGDIDLKKRDILSDDIRKFVKYIVEEPGFLLWEWKIEGMEPEFHFYAVINNGSNSFEAHEVDGEIFSEKSAMQMLEAVKTIRVKTPARRGL